MRNRDVATKIIFFLSGLGIGATLALLLAPQSGEETQEWMAEQGRKGLDQAKAKGRELRRRAQDLVDEGKAKVAEALEAGAEAFQKEKPKAERARAR